VAATRAANLRIEELLLMPLGTTFSSYTHAAPRKFDA
jgi:hypothetical protein